MNKIFILSLVFAACQGKSMQTTDSNPPLLQESNIVEISKNDTLLSGIQLKISDAFGASFMTHSNVNLKELEEQLANVFQHKENKLVRYWQSYLQFYQAIYFLKTNDKTNAEKAVDTGIEWLKAMDKKNSEDLALLAMLQGFSIQFNGMKAMFLSEEIKSNALTAIKMDSLNIRGYYVFASNDFYTPIKYGGGKEAEKYLIKAIKLPAQQQANAYLPSWGKEEAYEMLIRLYIKEEKWEEAKATYKMSQAEYPNSYTITQLAGQLISH